MTTPADDLSLPTDEIYWQVTDPDGNVVQSGGMSRAFAAGALAELLGSLTDDNPQE